MPKKTYTSPYASAFKSAVRRGTPCNVAVQNIAKRKGTSPKTVFNSLYKAGICNRQKFNGQWIYWPCDSEFCNTTATTAKNCQTNFWQDFVDLCIASGHCTPEKLNKACGTQKDFMTYCRKFFAKQFNGKTTGRKTSNNKGRKRTTSSRSTTRTTSSGNYKFPTGRTTSRRTRKAA